MKKSILMIAAATLALVACQRQELTPTPGVEETTDGVETQLVLSVSTGTPATRMAPGNVQRSNNFLGINDAKLLAFDNGYLGGPDNPTYVLRTDGAGWRQTYELGLLYTADKIPSVTENATSRSNRILKLMVPNGVNSVVFYGKAAVSPEGAEHGSTHFHMSDTLDNVYFHVERRIGTPTDVDNYDATARLMVATINYLMNSSVRKYQATEQYKGFYGLPATSVKEIGHIYGWKYREDPSYNHEPYNANMRNLSPLEQTLGEAYYAFSNVPENAYRAGSSRSILTMVNAMVSLMAVNNSNDPTDEDTANALRLGDEIERRVASVFEIALRVPNDPTSAYVTGFQDPDDIRAALGLSEDTRFDGAQDLNKYPYESFGIPEGAAQFSFSHAGIPAYGTGPVGTDEYYYLHPNDPLVNPKMDSFDPRKYVYPAELMYFCNSGLRVSNEEIADNDYPDGVNNWENGDYSKWAPFTNHGSVNPDTKAIAVRDNINYGVALLETSVGWRDDDDEMTLSDNRGAVLGITEGNKTFRASDTHFYLKGVLVGGVNPAYDWQYLPTQKFKGHIHDDTTAPYGEFDGVIYDDNINGADVIPSLAGVKGREIPVSKTDPNYTLVYDNYNPAKTREHQDSVYVTLEFVNMGESFYGKDDMIPTGGTFYLVARLEPGTSTDGKTNDFSGTWPTHYQIPPIYGLQGDTETIPDGKKAGQSKQIPRVFIQDYVTKATFRFGPTSLQNAFYSIPDLKSAQMSLGLSVDLSWIDGYTFDVEF